MTDDQASLDQPMRPEVITTPPDKTDAVDDGPITEPSKLIRIASMTKAMLEEVRQAPLDEAGRRRLGEIHQQSLAELRNVLSPELAGEFDGMFQPLTSDEVPSESVIRIAQAQLIGWLEGLFHGIQATLFTQQMAARAQLEELHRPPQIEPARETDPATGLYL